MSFRAEPRKARGLVRDHAAARLVHGLDDGRRIERHDRAQVDDFRIDLHRLHRRERTCTSVPYAMIVTSEPGRTISALPSGTR